MSASCPPVLTGSAHLAADLHVLPERQYQAAVLSDSPLPARLGSGGYEQQGGAADLPGGRTEMNLSC